MDNKTLHEKFMNRCLQLAQKGKGKVAPNPLVGAVIVHNGKIIGEGFHQKYGEPHAEVNAINSVTNKTLLPQSTIYVSLEPCAHFGKTPPCADLIINNKITNVVIGMQDPFAKVNGLGIKKMKQAGCHVKVGVLKSKCMELNKEFIVYHTQKRPFVILKWAKTLDGFIDVTRKPENTQQPNWITNEVCRSLVHKWRSEVKAIMVGTNTVKMDNPELNVRSWAGESPLRIVIDKNLSLSSSLKIFNNMYSTLVLNQFESKTADNTEFYKIGFGKNFISDLLRLLYKRGISSLFIEGGQALLNSFITEGCWDEARVFTGNKYFKKGVESPRIDGKIVAQEKLRDNILTVFN